MLCPLDGTTLVMADRSGVEIDYCPKCRGVWLDRGELDKVIEKAAMAPVVPQPVAPQPMPQPAQQSMAQPQAIPQPQGQRDAPRHRRDDDDYDDDHRGRKPYRKRESFLSELFDF